MPNETPFVFAFYFKTNFLYTLIQYCMTLTQNPTGAKGGAVPLALYSLKYNMDFKQNMMDFEGEVFISLPPFPPLLLIV